VAEHIPETPNNFLAMEFSARMFIETGLDRRKKFIIIILKHNFQYDR